jgi:signal transduction histidine kinase
MVVASCLTLALVHAGIWWRDRTSRLHLTFSITAVGVALFGCCEFAMMRADTPDAFGVALKWAHVPIFVMVWGVVSFVGADFGTGRPWLARAAWGLNLSTLVANLALSPNADYRVITGLDQVRLLGEQVSVARGTTSPWHWVGQASFALVFAFVADASLRLWRTAPPDRRRRAVVIGGATCAFVLLSAGQAALIFSGLVHEPHLVALAFVPVLFAMGFELGSDVLRAAQAEAATRDLSSRLIDAQEDERRRLARELHDDFSQRLALVSVRLQVLRPHAGNRATAELDRVSDDVRELASDVHRFAHQLHPAKLDQLGLATAVRSWCRVLSQQSGLHIEAAVDGVPEALPPDVALCAYRVIQESTQNAVRHSGARTVTVSLSMPDGLLRLVVADDGRGFDVKPARRGGLGLVSMRERVRPLGGTLTVESQPGRGTRVELGLPVPLAAQSAATEVGS